MLSYIQQSYQEPILDTVSSVLCVTVTLDCSGQLYHTLSQVKICLNEPIKSPYHWNGLSTVFISKTCSGQGRTMMNRLSHLSASYRLSPLIDG